MDNWPELTITHNSEGGWVVVFIETLVTLNGESLFDVLNQIELELNTGE
jgi:hypothetical protein